MSWRIADLTPEQKTKVFLLDVLVHIRTIQPNMGKYAVTGDWNKGEEFKNTVLCHVNFPEDGRVNAENISLFNSIDEAISGVGNGEHKWVRS
jgi:hypothetical protein